MGAVARRAGVAIKTMYRLVQTKADLFKGVVPTELDGSSWRLILRHSMRSSRPQGVEADRLRHADAR